ncbi:uncharacterized protein LOC143256063 [Tachypleus tridentatus]|uniref:uncharacterized protein LOC143256063 n=1 Tax=Tachypleus tridentatus TaxID=6853 RepID=UPI003FD24DF8
MGKLQCVAIIFATFTLVRSDDLKEIDYTSNNQNYLSVARQQIRVGDEYASGDDKYSVLGGAGVHSLRGKELHGKREYDVGRVGHSRSCRRSIGSEGFGEG